MPLSEYVRFPIIIAATIMCLVPVFPHAGATPEYAAQTRLECNHCHESASGGGALTPAGTAFLDSLKAKGLYRQLSAVQGIARLFIGYLHILAAIIWFGTILYVHVLLKPAYASKGLPKGELRLGWISMIIVLVSGILLTIARMPSWQALFSTRYGILLLIKIILFLIMLSSALVVSIYIGPRLKKKCQSPVATLMTREMTAAQLSQFDGRDGRSAYVAYKGIVYDVSQGRFWKNGLHAMKHAAGNDLTAILKNAPHGEEKVLAMPQIGTLRVAGGEPSRPFHERLFYFFAYMNLVLVFIIIFIIALWKWWP